MRYCTVRSLLWGVVCAGISILALLLVLDAEPDDGSATTRSFDILKTIVMLPNFPGFIVGWWSRGSWPAMFTVNWLMWFAVLRVFLFYPKRTQRSRQVNDGKTPEQEVES